VQKSSAEGGNRLQSFLRSTLIATDHTGLPHVESMTITGPFNVTGSGDTPSRRRVFVCRPTFAKGFGGPGPTFAKGEDPKGEDQCAKQIIATLARRGFRRPVTPAEAEPSSNWLTSRVVRARPPSPCSSPSAR
jgi:hypothetical protein